MGYEISVAPSPVRPLLVVRRRAVPSEWSRVIPEACGTVWNFVRQHQVPGPGRHVAVYLDDLFHLEIGVEIESPFPGDSEILCSAIPAGIVASTTHYGPYSELSNAHAAIRAWCMQHDKPLAGRRWEIYGHWDPEWNAHPEQIRTEVFYLLATPPRSEFTH